MKAISINVLAALGIMAAANGPALAHGCSGGSCNTTSPTAEALAESASTSHGGEHRQSIDGNSSSLYAPNQSQTSIKRMTVFPVQTAQPIVITPSANVSRYAGNCGPRMVVVARDVEGRYFGAMSTDEFVAGEDHRVMPAQQPYVFHEIAPGLKHLIGHRMVETTSVVTVSGGRSIGLGIVRSDDGGSGTVGGGGAMQRLVTTIRLEECLAYEMRDPVPAKPAPKAKPKRRPVRKAAPAPAGQPVQTVTTITTTTTEVRK